MRNLRALPTRRHFFARQIARAARTGSSTTVQLQESAASPVQLRRAIEPYHGWIESRLGVPWGDAILLQMQQSVSDLALLGCA